MDRENDIMDGKTCVVTGATSGIGRVSARALAEKGATLVVVGRNEEKCRHTVREIREATGNKDVEYLLADLSIQQQVRQLAEQIRVRYDSLDVLVNNAGAIFTSRQETDDGLEKTFALNHLSYFYLSNLLIDKLKECAPSRIVNVASGAHRGHQIDFDDLARQQGYRSQQVYGESKLANILFTYELARRLEGSGVTVNALHPGFVASNFGTNNGPLVTWFMKFLHLFGRSPEEGAETVIYLASSPEVEAVSGKYYMDKEPVKSSPESYDRESALKLWEISMEITGLEVTV